MQWLSIRSHRISWMMPIHSMMVLVGILRWIVRRRHRMMHRIGVLVMMHHMVLDGWMTKREIGARRVTRRRCRSIGGGLSVSSGGRLRKGAWMRMRQLVGICLADGLGRRSDGWRAIGGWGSSGEIVV